MSRFKQKYTDEQLLQLLHDFKEKYGRVPSSTDINKEEGYPRGSIYTYRFGSFQNALKLAGLKREKIKNDKYSDEYLMKCYKEIVNYYNRQPSLTEINEYVKNKKGFPSARTFASRFDGIDNLHKLCGFEAEKNGMSYQKDFLLNELKRFYKENGRVPTSSEFDKANTGYPSRKTYSKYFGSFNNALILAGFTPKNNTNPKAKPMPDGVKEYNKENLRYFFFKFIDEFGKVPTVKEMEKAKGYPTRQAYRKVFGSWNQAMIEFGFEPRNMQYTDEELKEAFLSFVEKHGRIPSYKEFNNSEYPSFWCYQQRFGSWNNAVKAYGFEPNNEGLGFVYRFEDGELVKSKYEFDVSTYFRKNNIKYDRDVPYKKYIKNYKGRKNCDYVIDYKGSELFIEIAGLYTDNKNKSYVEKDYIRRFNDKLKLLEKSNLNYFVLYPKDFKEKTLDEIFSFLK